MAARSIGSLMVSFGRVSIPVKLYSATEASRAISFNLLHKACGSRLRQQYFCVKEDVAVAREDMVKGYEFAKALAESGRCALGRWAARGKQYIVMIRPVEDGLVMQQLLYAGEVRSIKELDIPKTEVKAAELKLAQQLIDQQAAKGFDPSAYKDEVRERIEAAIEKKVEGQEVTTTEAPEAGAQVIDLMDALRASLEARKPAKRAEPAEAVKPARKSAKK